MRILPILLVIFLTTGALLGQSVQEVDGITIKYEDAPLIEILDYLADTYDLSFAYDVAALGKIRASINADRWTLQKVLRQLLSPHNLDFQLQTGGVLILPGKQEPNKTDRLDWDGTIYDASTGETLPFASIMVRNTNVGTSSNADGHFLLQDIPDTSEIIISYLGYQPKTLSVSEAVQTSTILLNSREEQLPELLVLHEVEAFEPHRDAGHTTFNPKSLNGLPTLGEVDILRSLQLLPGISATNETSSGLVVRGSPPDQNLILFDGFSVFQLDHFLGVFSAFNHRAIKDVQLYKGGFDARYGGRTSSVIDITGKSGNAHQLALGASVSLISLNAAVETPLGKKWTLLAAGRRAFTDIIQSKLYRNLVENVRNNEKNSPQNRLGFTTQDLDPTFYFFDYNLKLTFRPGPKDVLSFSLYQGEDDLTLQAEEQVQAANLSLDDRAEWGNIGASLRWARQWNPKWYSQARFSSSDYHHDTSYKTSVLFDDGTQNQTFESVSELLNNLEAATLAFDTEYKASPKYSMQFGASLEGLTTELNSQLDDSLSNQEIFQEGVLFSSYWQNYWQPWERVLISAGIRNQHFDLIDRTLWEPRLGIQLKLNQKFTVKGAWGRYYQVVNRIINSDINNGLPDFWVLADDENNILFKKSYHFVAGLLFNSGVWTVDVEAYHKSVDGLVDFIPLGRYFSTEVLPAEQFVQGTGEARGMDILLQKEGKRYSSWLSYSLSKVEDQFPELNSGLAFPSNEDQRHEFKTVHMLEVGKWKLSGTWIYATGKPFTAPEGYFPAAGVGATPITIFQIGAVNSFRLPDYHRLDLSATYQWNWGSWKMESGLSIYNVYDRTNTKFRRFDVAIIDPSGGELLDQPKIVTSNVNMLGFTPNFFINFEL